MGDGELMGLQELPDDVDRLGHGSPGAKAKLGRAKKLFRNKLEAGTEHRSIKFVVDIGERNRAVIGQGSEFGGRLWQHV